MGELRQESKLSLLNDLAFVNGVTGGACFEAKKCTDSVQEGLREMTVRPGMR